MQLTVVSATLAGMAAAVRLAKLGHDVTLTTGGDPLGGHWAATAGPGGELVDALPQIFVLPAVWRDLWKKSGRAFDADLTRAGYALVDAPAAVHRFADGLEFALPAERGQQFATLTHHLGRAAATRWRDLLDDLDDTWLALRRHGVEAPTPLASATGADLAHLMPRRTLTDLADHVAEPHLAQLVLSQGWRTGTDHPRAPALLASRLVIERTFGRWQVRTDAGPARASSLIDLLADRLTLRHVHLADHSDAPPLLDATPTAPPSRWRHRTHPALAPRIRHTLVEASGDDITEVVDHGARTVAWHRPLGDGRTVESRHDYAHPIADPAWGLAPDTWRAVADRTPIAGVGAWRASTCSPAGNEPWAELASAALAVYEVHEHLTGEDARPTNRARRT